MTPPIRAENSSSIYKYSKTIHTNLPKWNSTQKYGTPIFPAKPGPSVWTFSKMNGALPWASELHSWAFKPSYALLNHVFKCSIFIINFIELYSIIILRGSVRRSRRKIIHGQYLTIQPNCKVFIIFKRQWTN